MDRQIFTTRVKTNLNGVLQMTQVINGIMMTGDNAANQIIVELYDGVDKIDIEPVSETHKIIGYFIRSDGFTVEVMGDVEEGNAVIIVPAIAYEVSGSLSIAIRIMEDPETVTEESGATHVVWNKKIVIAALSCYVQITESDAIIDPAHRIPDVEELLGYIEELDRKSAAIALAESGRVAAEAGRVTAESGRVSAESDRVTAENARVSAETARSTAEINRDIAETGRTAAEAARVTAESGRVTAETSRVNAEATRQSEHTTVMNKINNMDAEVFSQDYYTQPTIEVTEVNGHKHIRLGLAPGDPFVIAKIFASVAEMNAYTGTDIRTGQFVIINTNDVQDPDDAKMYIKTDSGYSFITDLSGAQGIRGPQGIQGETGNGISGASLDTTNYTLTFTYTDGTTYTTPISIRGETGATGNGISSVTIDNETYHLTINYTNGDSVTLPASIRGPQGAPGRDGIDGAPGEQGPQGEPGVNSITFDYDDESQALTLGLH